MKNKEVKKSVNFLIFFLAVALIFIPFISAGVGISWDQESALIPENSKVCMEYKVYNPWAEDSYIKIKLSDSLMAIVSSVDDSVEFVPKETSSKNAIPVKFCFKTPKVYKEDCLLFNKLICKQDCTEAMKIYEGEVEVLEVDTDDAIVGGAGGSATAMSVSAPLRVKVQCIAHATNYSLIYILIAVIAFVLLIINLFKKKKKK